jgi:hypothetical protein
MESRPYFILGDFVVNILTGVAAALATIAVVGPGWNMMIGMFVGMALGMALAMLLSLAVFAAFFGAMEVMLPAMLTGMAAGMWLGMAAPMGAIGALQAVEMGAVTGVGVVVFTYGLNAFLRGKVS